VVDVKNTSTRGLTFLVICDSIRMCLYKNKNHKKSVEDIESFGRGKRLLSSHKLHLENGLELCESKESARKREHSTFEK
jgi:hypothetical protein